MPKNVAPRYARARRLLSGGAVAAGATAIGLGVMAAPASAAEHDWSGVAQCESGGDWSINTGNGYYGGLQFSASTWDGYGGTVYAARADLASPSDQVAIAEKVLASQGIGAWPVCGKHLTGGTTRVAAAPAVAKPAPPAPATAKAATPKAATPKPATPKAATPKPATPTPAPVPAGSKTPGTTTSTTPRHASDQTAAASTGRHAAPSGRHAAAGDYTVAPGDTLSTIAADHGTTWQALYAQNTGVVGGNPDLILPGEVLALAG
jgi:outer membrane biosynthesis protein TonB